MASSHASASDEPTYGGRAPGTIAFSWVFATIATALVALRLYTWFAVSRHGGWAMIWIVVAWLFSMCSTIFSTIDAVYGQGNHFWIIVKNGDVGKVRLWGWIVITVFQMSIAFGKVAVCSLLLAVLEGTRRKIRIFLHVLAVANVVLSIPHIFLTWLQCDPPEALLDPTRRDECDMALGFEYWYFLGGLAALSDFILAAIPMFILWRLQVPRKIKLGVSCLMGLGIFTGVAAIIRTTYSRKILAPDPSYPGGILHRWAKAEELLVVIAAVIPPLWPLFVHKFKKTIRSIHPSNSKSDQHPQHPKMTYRFEHPAKLSPTGRHGSDDRILPPTLDPLGSNHNPLHSSTFYMRDLSDASSLERNEQLDVIHEC